MKEKYSKNFQKYIYSILKDRDVSKDKSISSPIININKEKYSKHFQSYIISVSIKRNKGEIAWK